MVFTFPVSMEHRRVVLSQRMSHSPSHDLPARHANLGAGQLLQSRPARRTPQRRRLRLLHITRREHARARREAQSHTAQPPATSRQPRQSARQLDCLGLLANPARHTRHPRSDLPRLSRVGRRRAEQHRPLQQMRMLHLGQAAHGKRTLPSGQVGTGFDRREKIAAE